MGVSDHAICHWGGGRTVHGNTPDDALSQMLLQGVSPGSRCPMLGVLTATSRTSFWPLFSVVKALRMGGSCSVSNLTSTTAPAVGRQRRLSWCLSSWSGGAIAGCARRFFPTTARPRRQWLCTGRRTNDLMNLSILGGSIRRCESRGQSGCEALLDGLESALHRCRAAGGERGGPETAISIASVHCPSSIGSSAAVAYLLSILSDGDGWVWEEGCWMEEADEPFEIGRAKARQHGHALSPNGWDVKIAPTL